MKLFYKAIVAFVLSIGLIASVSTNTVHAAVPVQEIPIQPLWTHVLFVEAMIRFEGTTAYCTANAAGHPGTTQVDLEMKLQQMDSKGGLTTLQTWTSSGSGFTHVLDKTYTVKRGNTYSVQVTAKITRNGATESKYTWVEATCP